MRILWFSVTPSLFNPKSNSHNGGGWIASLEQIVRCDPEVNLGVAFKFQDNQFRYENKGVSYYPIPSPDESRFKRIILNNASNKISYYLKIIDDFRPDLIQIFGSENDFGLICHHTSIPVVIHIQGCLPPYRNALFPIGMNVWDFVFTKGLSLQMRYMGLRSNHVFKRNAEREIDIIQHCQYFMGRTGWDKGLISLFNPNATYFHCEEALRDSFINSEHKWSFKVEHKFVITSTISRPWYKGVDLILKTASLLKQFTNLDFEWRIYGVSDIKFYEHKYKIRATDVNVNVMGTASKDQLVNALCNTTLYVHPSYIDNSPNSVCEAQILGVPVIATNVGGLSSLINNGETGFLIPANDPYRLAFILSHIYNDKILLEKISRNSIELAQKRHDPLSIRNTLINIYKTILRCS